MRVAKDRVAGGGIAVVVGATPSHGVDSSCVTCVGLRSRLSWPVRTGEWSGNARYKIWNQGNFTTGRWPAQRGLAPVIPPKILDIRQSHLAFRLAARPHRAISRFWNPRVRITANRSLSSWVSNARRQIARCQPCPVIRCESCLHAQPYLMFPLLPTLTWPSLFILDSVPEPCPLPARLSTFL